MDSPPRSWTWSRALAASFFVVWGICVGLALTARLSGRPLPPFFISEDPRGGPPVLLEIRSGPNVGFHHSELRIGDRLLSIGGRRLDGVGPVELFVAVAEAGRAGDEVVVRFERDGVAGSSRLRLPPHRLVWFVLPTAVAWALLALVLFFRSSWRRASRSAFWASAGVAMTVAFFSGSYPEVLLSAAVLAAGTSGMVIFGLFFCLSFPDDFGTRDGEAEQESMEGSTSGPGGSIEASGERGAPSAATEGERWPWLFAVTGLFEVSRDFGWGLPPSVGRTGFVLCLALGLALGLRILARKLPSVGPVVQRQIRWVLFGFAWGAVPLLIAAMLLIADESFVPFYRFALAIAGVLPAAWCMVIFRLQAFDVDRLLSVATTYTIVVVLLLAAGLYIQSQLIAGTLQALGGASMVSQAILVLFLAALSLPAYRRIRPLVERSFFLERVALSEGIGRLMDELGSCGRVEEIWIRTGESVFDLIHPRSCAIYLLSAPRFTPIFHRGAAAPPEIEAGDPLGQALVAERVSVDLEAWQRAGRLAGLSLQDREMLAALDAALLVPVRRRGELLALIVLGEKRSGDIYTVGDHTLLEALARVIASELERFDDSKLSAIGESLAQMMHDLRNPLGIISAYTEMLAAAESAEEKDEIIATMQQQFALMNRMVGDVLSFARGEASLLVTTVHLNSYLGELRRQLEPLLERTNVSLRINPGYVDAAQFDVAKLTRVILNIARNAAEAMPRGGTFTVATSVREERLIFTLSDDGPGMSDKTLQRLFQPAAGSHEPEGSGLGLVIAKKIVEEHGGDIAVESRLGVGSTFRVSLPLRPRGREQPLPPG